MRILLPCLIVLSAVSRADIKRDLLDVGVPATDARVEDSMLVVDMPGSLAQGDSLLKHYGGVFYTAVDSILAGWDVLGIAVHIDDATLLFTRRDMLTMFSRVNDSTDDEAIADWVLNHTRVLRVDTIP